MVKDATSTGAAYDTTLITASAIEIDYTTKTENA
jgi:hypothetical protein